MCVMMQPAFAMSTHTHSFHQSPLYRSMDVDPSAAVLWLLAVSTAVAAGLWAGSDFAFEAKCIRSTFDDEVHLLLL